MDIFHSFVSKTVVNKALFVAQVPARTVQSCLWKQLFLPSSLSFQPAADNDNTWKPSLNLKAESRVFCQEESNPLGMALQVGDKWLANTVSLKKVTRRVLAGYENHQSAVAWL